jgi:lipoprotein-releasing system permease protein
LPARLEKRMMFIILTLIVAVAAFNLVQHCGDDGDGSNALTLRFAHAGRQPEKHHGDFVVQGAMVGVIGTLAGLLFGLAIAFKHRRCPAQTAAERQLFAWDIYLISRMPS